MAKMDMARMDMARMDMARMEAGQTRRSCRHSNIRCSIKEIA